MSAALSRDATLLAFDYGEKRIGVAVGNLLTRTARALVIVRNLNPRAALQGGRRVDRRMEA